jgi:ParB-like chromosome segregation protein Spo0J
MEKPTKPLRLAFERDCIEVALTLLHGGKVLPPTIKESVKYGQIKASLLAIGLVEPIAVVRHPAHQGAYMVLDGHLRLEALRDLGVEHALCLIATDDEGFTYNKRINRLSVVQEHRMIVRAVDRGTSISRLVNALGISESAIRARFKLPDGVCDEAVRLLADKPVSRGLFRALRQMTPFRQIDVAQSMVSLNNYSVKLSLAMLQATPADQLTDQSRVKFQKEGSSQALQRLQRELAAVQADTKLLEEGYGPANLQLVVIKSYFQKLLENAKVVRWLARFHAEYLQQLQLIADIKELPSS